MSALNLYRGIHLTADDLADAGACLSQVDTVRQLYPGGARLSLEVLRGAARVGLDVGWLARFLPPPAWGAYNQARASARDACERATAPARDAYDQDLALAQDAFNQARAPAWAAYYQALVSALWDVLPESEAPC